MRTKIIDDFVETRKEAGKTEQEKTSTILLLTDASNSKTGIIKTIFANGELNILSKLLVDTLTENPDLRSLFFGAVDYVRRLESSNFKEPSDHAKPPQDETK